jgi:hypothetical protein
MVLQAPYPITVSAARGPIAAYSERACHLIKTITPYYFKIRFFEKVGNGTPKVMNTLQKLNDIFIEQDRR